MLNVNTIEFNGRKAVINSYSDHPALADSMARQREQWAERFPNAIVKTERMDELTAMRLVDAAGTGPDAHNFAWTIGKSSQEIA